MAPLQLRENALALTSLALQVQELTGSAVVVTSDDGSEESSDSESGSEGEGSRRGGAGKERSDAGPFPAIRVSLSLSLPRVHPMPSDVLGIQ
jgi:hypothetical protein